MLLTIVIAIAQNCYGYLLPLLLAIASKYLLAKTIANTISRTCFHCISTSERDRKIYIVASPSFSISPYEWSYKKNSAKRDTQPLKGRDLTHKCSLGRILKDHLVEKIWSVWKKTRVGGKIILRGRGWVWHKNLSVALLSRAQELPFLILFWPPRAPRVHHPPRGYP